MANCSKCNQNIDADDMQSGLAKSLGLTLCIDCWLNILHGDKDVTEVATIVKLGTDGKVPANLLPSSGGSYQHEIRYVLLTSNPANPAIYYGYGTWTQRAQGRVIIGLDSTDPDYDAVGDVAGSKTHTHSDHPAITHSKGTSPKVWDEAGGDSSPSDHPAMSHSTVSHMPAAWVCYVFERTA